MLASWRECDWTVWLNRVAIAEYTRLGRQEDKAREIRISRSFYHKNLNEAHYRAEQMLIDKNL